ncbi:ABC transporter ATP-binding protein [Flavobacterium sp.]|uniref:ABC transporter ATP-binding protein n=1 Tax=Flavobacterium sp. TaxID=239 RepID=UPI003753CFC2
MSKPVIKVDNLSKAYQIGQIGTGTLSRDIDRFWKTKILGKEDPFLKIGETNDRSTKGDSDIVWSLKDINFEVNQGEAVGIIGKNGAGKSTLLKLLSRVTSPTTGSIKVKGRIASLLEVGTGFHPELSGRENIYLNGAILGMRKKEITRKLDEIIDFSGVERYIDTPVKRYSSGMYVRLAFAVAAHLESEILIVDEVLAVGDAEFQKKCLGKMGDISKGEGRTLLFVSHNMAAIQSLCSKGLFIENGIINSIGNTEQIVKKYLHKEQSVTFQEDLFLLKRDKDLFPILQKIVIQPNGNKVTSGSDFCFRIYFDTSKIKKLSIGYLIKDYNYNIIKGANTYQYSFKIDVIESKNYIDIEIPNLPLTPGQYSISLFLGDGKYDLDMLYDVIYFNVFWNNNLEIDQPHPKFGSIYSKTNWKY